MVVKRPLMRGLTKPLGVVLPLPAETYTLWFQETDGTEIDYEFQVTIVQVPEPSTLSLLGIPIFGIFCRNRKSKG